MTLVLTLKFLLLLLVWSVVYHASFLDMMSVWTQSKTYEHGMLIIPISLWLAFRKKDQLLSTEYKSSYLPLLLMIIPAFIWMLGKSADIALFEHFSAIMSLQLLIWFCIGTKKAKIAFFPLFYLFFCIPFGEELIPKLQVITADITVFLVQLSGIPIYRDGLYLTIPNGVFLVAEACSGIRFLISSIALGFLFSYLSFTKWWKHFIFILFSCLFPIIANGIRAYGIVMIGYLSDMKYATGADHLVYGWFFFSIVVITIFVVANKFADDMSEQDLIKRSYASDLKSHYIAFKKEGFYSICLILCFMFQLVWLNNLKAPQAEKNQLFSLPNDFVALDESNWGVSFPNAHQSQLATKQGSTTEFYIASSFTNEKEFISYKNKLYNNDFWTLASRDYRQEKDIKLNLTQIVNNRGEHRTIVHWYCINQHCTNSQSEVKLLKAFYTIASKPVVLSFKAMFTENIINDELNALIYL